MARKKPDPASEKPKQLTLRLPADLHKQLKIAAVAAGRPMGEIALELFREFLKKQAKK